MENTVATSFLIKPARVVSVMFHPLLIPVYGLLVIFMAPTVFFFLPADVKRLTVTVFVTTDVMIPMALIPLLIHRGIISSWTIDSASDRIITLLFITVLYSITCYLIHGWHIPQFLKAYAYSIAIITLLILVITVWWRISVHAAGAGVLTAIIFTLGLRMSTPLVLYVTLSLFISGMILSARLILNKHNASEVYGGYITGFAGIMLLMALFQ